MIWSVASIICVVYLQTPIFFNYFAIKTSKINLTLTLIMALMNNVAMCNDVLPVYWMKVYPKRFNKSTSLLHVYTENKWLIDIISCYTNRCFSIGGYINWNRIELTKWTIRAFRILNPHTCKWSFVIKSLLKIKMQCHNCTKTSKSQTEWVINQHSYFLSN